MFSTTFDHDKKVHLKRGRNSITSSFTSSEGNFKAVSFSNHNNNDNQVTEDLFKEGQKKEEQPEKARHDKEVEKDRTARKELKKLPRSKLRRKTSDRRVMARRGAMHLGSTSESALMTNMIDGMKKLQPF